jgi:hypothetical protein
MEVVLGHFREDIINLMGVLGTLLYYCDLLSRKKKAGLTVKTRKNLSFRP